jgi:hypothetical protein
MAVKKSASNLNALGFGFSSWVEFIKLARIFEDTGVSAYNGAAGFIMPARFASSPSCTTSKVRP